MNDVIDMFEDPLEWMLGVRFKEEPININLVELSPEEFLQCGSMKEIIEREYGQDIERIVLK